MGQIRGKARREGQSNGIPPLLPVERVEKPAVFNAENIEREPLPGREGRDPFGQLRLQIGAVGRGEKAEKIFRRQAKKPQDERIGRAGELIVPQRAVLRHPSLVHGPGQPRDPQESLPGAAGKGRLSGQSFRASTT